MVDEMKQRLRALEDAQQQHLLVLQSMRRQLKTLLRQHRQLQVLAAEVRLHFECEACPAAVAELLDEMKDAMDELSRNPLYRAQWFFEQLHDAPQNVIELAGARRLRRGQDG